LGRRIGLAATIGIRHTHTGKHTVPNLRKEGTRTSMLLTVVLAAGGVLLAAVLAVIGLIVWQATVRPYTLEELFVLPDESLLPMENERGDPRIVPLEGGINFRDLGGYETADGRRVRWGQVYRSARLSELTDGDVARIAALGIRTVVDFRQSEDASEYPNRLLEGVDYHHLPVFEVNPMSHRRVLLNRHRLLDAFAAMYVSHIVEQGAPVFGALMRLLADESHLPLLFHCTAGKDRTGVAAALILRALGVPRETVVRDYLLTNHSAQIFIDEVNAQIGERNTRLVAAEQLYPLMAASPRLIGAALDHIDTRYGGVEPYLRQRAGLSDDTLARLREVLLV
jgi:protein-tyrosine phosphatase